MQRSQPLAVLQFERLFDLAPIDALPGEEPDRRVQRQGLGEHGAQRLVTAARACPGERRIGAGLGRHEVTELYVDERQPQLDSRAQASIVSGGSRLLQHHRRVGVAVVVVEDLPENSESIGPQIAGRRVGQKAIEDGLCPAHVAGLDVVLGGCNPATAHRVAVTLGRQPQRLLHQFGGRVPRPPRPSPLSDLGEFGSDRFVRSRCTQRPVSRPLLAITD